MAASMCRCFLRSQKFKVIGLRLQHEYNNGTVSNQFCTNANIEYYEDDEVEKLRDVSRLRYRLKKKVNKQANKQPYRKPPLAPDALILNLYSTVRVV